jgi:hypothetical protein
VPAILAGMAVDMVILLCMYWKNLEGTSLDLPTMLADVELTGVELAGTELAGAKLVGAASSSS